MNDRGNVTEVQRGGRGSEGTSTSTTTTCVSIKRKKGNSGQCDGNKKGIGEREISGRWKEGRRGARIMLLSAHQIFNRVAVVWSYKCREAGRNYQVGKMVI